MLALSFIFLSLLVASSNAANDWSTPCFSGSCQYDLPESDGSASGTVMIWGSSNSISDITPAGGWEIIGCSPDALQQDIRLVCKDGSAVDCGHLFDGTTNASNAVGKVVRLPENCGQNAFAVVTNSYLAQDQSIPDSATSTLSRRDGTAPTVQGLSLDTSLPSGSPPWGPVNFAVKASNFPGASSDLSTVREQQRRSNSRVMRRGVSSFVDNAVNEMTSRDDNDVNINQSKTLTPVDVDKTFNVLDQSISCPSASANMKIDVATKAHAVVTIGVAATGTILPPTFSSFALTGGLNANLDGSIVMQASATGSLDSGNVKLFNQGIPGLDIPGILTIGPTFEINGQATANLDLSAEMTIGVSYAISNAQFVFPPNGQQSTGSFNIGDTPLKLSAGATASATGTVEAHVIPSLNFGITALSNSVTANVLLALDASATMTLSAGGSASAGTVNPRRELASRKIRRGLHASTEPSLNIRSPQDSTSDAGADNSVDGSQDNSGVDSTDTSQDNSGDNSVDNSQDNSGNTPVDNTQDNSADNSVDNLGDASSGDTSSTNAANDGSTDSTTAGDTSTDSNSPTDGSDNTDFTGASTGTDASSNDTSDTSTSSPSDTSSATDSATDNTDTSTDSTNNDGTTDNANTAGTSATDASAADTSAADASAADPTVVADASGSTASGSFGGCFEVVGALDASVGADASFFGLFDASTKLPLFNQQFEILPKKCFGSSQAVPTRRELSNSISLRSASPIRSRLFSAAWLTGMSMMKRDGLSCPAAGTSLQSVLDQTVSASQITQK